MNSKHTKHVFKQKKFKVFSSPPVGDPVLCPEWLQNQKTLQFRSKSALKFLQLAKRTKFTALLQDNRHWLVPKKRILDFNRQKSDESTSHAIQTRFSNQLSYCSRSSIPFTCSMQLLVY